MIYGYARVSTKEQNTDRQITALQEYDPTISIENETLFVEKISGKKSAEEREEYRVLRRILKSGDVLVIAELDRLGRTKQIIKEELEYFKNKKVQVKILNIPTTLIELNTETNWVLDMINSILLEVYTSLAQQELVQKQERQRGGIEEAKKRGVYKGRKPIEIDMDKFGSLYTRWKDGDLRTNEFQQLMGLKVSTFYRTVRAFEDNQVKEVTT